MINHIQLKYAEVFKVKSDSTAKQNVQRIFFEYNRYNMYASSYMLDVTWWGKRAE